MSELVQKGSSYVWFTGVYANSLAWSLWSTALMRIANIWIF